MDENGATPIEETPQEPTARHAGFTFQPDGNISLEISGLLSISDWAIIATLAARNANKVLDAQEALLRQQAQNVPVLERVATIPEDIRERIARKN